MEVRGILHYLNTYITFLCSKILLEMTCVSFVILFSFAEQLVLYMKAEEFLSSALHAAKENIKQGQLRPSATVKQGETNEVRKTELQLSGVSTI